MDEENRPATPDDGSVQIRTPAAFYVTPETLPQVIAALAPMRGAQGEDPTTCPLTAHQFICVSGEVVTTVRPGDCVASVKCLSGGVGTDPCPPGKPQPCSFKFFQNLCVQVDVTFVADAKCTLNDVQCLGADTGPCPPQ